LERLPQAPQGAGSCRRQADHLRRLPGALRQCCGVLPRSSLATVHRSCTGTATSSATSPRRRSGRSRSCSRRSMPARTLWQRAKRPSESSRNCSAFASPKRPNLLKRGSRRLPDEHWRRIRTTDVIDKPFRAGFLEFVRDLGSFCATGRLSIATWSDLPVEHAQVFAEPIKFAEVTLDRHR
jgi:hypothetical protein